MNKIVTLGPEGTCSEQAAIHYLSLRALKMPIFLLDSFEQAILTLLKNEASHAIIPVAYTKLNHILFEYNDMIELVDSFAKPTSTFVLAGIKTELDGGRKQTIALHASPEPILKKFNLQYDPLYAKSNVVAAILAESNQVDLALTTIQAAKKYNLNIYKVIGEFKMFWLVFSKTGERQFKAFEEE